VRQRQRLVTSLFSSIKISSYYTCARYRTWPSSLFLLLLSLVVIAYVSCCLRGHIEVVTNIRKRKVSSTHSNGYSLFFSFAFFIHFFCTRKKKLERRQYSWSISIHIGNIQKTADIIQRVKLNKKVMLYDPYMKYSNSWSYNDNHHY
jgi:hypothetical protein